MCPCGCSEVDERIAHVAPAAEVNGKVDKVVVALRHGFSGLSSAVFWPNAEFLSKKSSKKEPNRLQRYRIPRCLIPFVKPIDQHIPGVAIGNVPQQISPGHIETLLEMFLEIQDFSSSVAAAAPQHDGGVASTSSF